jgi:ABC-type transporter Mla subunit MlaD
MMQKNDREVAARRERVQDLTRELAKLVALSREQRRRLDQLLGQLEMLAQQAQEARQGRERPLVKTAGKNR